MKYCSKCGNELLDEAVICPKCGCSTGYRSNADLKNIAKIFMIIATVMSGVWILPLAWCLPMTLYYYKKVENHEPVSIGFKICTLLFVSTVSGVLMLCDND